MKLEKFRLILLSAVIVTSLLFSGTAYAQDEELPDPGITPDSPLYFLDNWGKNVGLFFAFGPEAKARKALEYSEERLAEAQAMATKNKVREMERAADSYNGFLAMVRERAEEVEQQDVSEDISETVALATAKHLHVLDEVKDKAPEEAEEAIARAREASMNGQRNALLALAKVKPDRAIEINSATIENRLNRADAKASENITEEVEEALADADELLGLEEEISEIAQELSENMTAIEQRVARATSNRLEVLARVYEKVPDQAKPAIERAMANSVRKHERAVEALKERDALGEISEELPIPERVREEVKERLRAAVSENGTAVRETTQERGREEVKERVRTPPEAQSSNDKPEADVSENSTEENKESTAGGRGQARNP